MAMLSPGCAADVPDDVPDDAPDVVAGDEPLATVRLSETHTISFFDRGEGGGDVIETANLDLDGELLLRSELTIVHGHYADAYLQVVGDQVDAKALARLQDFDLRAAQDPTSDEDLAPSQPEEPAPALFSAPTGPIEKDFSSDFDWFRTTYCNGCNGSDANRQPGAPATWPACTTNPEFCMATNQALTYKRKSKNYNSVGVNYSATQSMTFAGYYTDTCENSSWWERNFGDCNLRGTRLFFLTLAPRAIQGWSATNSTSWTRRFEARGTDIVGMMVDTY